MEDKQKEYLHNWYKAHYVPKPPRKLNCRICHKSFTANTSRSNQQIFCSLECRNTNRNMMRIKKQPEKRICPICHKSFTTKRKDRIGCSDSCVQKLWIKNNPEKDKQRQRNPDNTWRANTWKLKNPEKAKNIRSHYRKQRWRQDVKYQLDCRMGTAIRKALKGNKNWKKWQNLVGYTIEELHAHLATTLPEGVTWEDFLKGGYHIDHIIPQSTYKYQTYEDEEFKKCWALRNLRVFLGTENLSKLAKLDIDLVKKHNIQDLLPKEVVK